jgi:hypothetical protein
VVKGDAVRRWRSFVPAAVACTALLCPIASRAQTASSPPPCRIVEAVLDDELDSGRTRTGTIFHFSVAATGGGAALHGTGIVDFVRGARRGGSAGQIGIETRFIEQPDGTHVPATLVVLGTLHASVIEGRTRNAPVALAAVGAFRPTPYQIAAGIIGAYGALHFGSQAVLARGTPLLVLLGDDYLTGGCSVGPP